MILKIKSVNILIFFVYSTIKGKSSELNLQILRVVINHNLKMDKDFKK